MAEWATQPRRFCKFVVQAVVLIREKYFLSRAGLLGVFLVGCAIYIPLFSFFSLFMLRSFSLFILSIFSFSFSFSLGLGRRNCFGDTLAFL